MKIKLSATFPLFFLLLLYPFFKFIWFQRYPLMSPEVLVMTGCLLLVATLVALISTRPFWLAIWFGLAFYVIITTGPTYVSPTNLIIRGIIVAAIIVALTLSKKHLANIVSVCLLGILVTDLVLGLPRMPKFDELSKTPVQTNLTQTEKKLSHVLFVVFDEHIGVAGLPDNIAATRMLKKNLTDFYVENGFDLYTKAFSRYYYTEDAIPNTLNNTSLDKRAAYFPDFKKSERVYLLKKNKVFDLFQTQGFSIRVYQTPFLDFCQGNVKVESCLEYPHNWVGAILNPAYTFPERLRVILSQFIMTNSLVREINGGIIDHDWLKTRTGPLETFPIVLNRIQNDMLKATHNTVFFAHLLMPHFPYVYDAACNPRPVADWKNRREFGLTDPRDIRAASDERYRLYAEQTECLNLQLNNFFDTLKKTGLYDSTEIILYSDHGARILRAHIPSSSEAEILTVDEIKDSFSVLFATKPFHQRLGRIVADQHDSVDLVWSTLGEKTQTHHNPEPFVYLRNNDEKRHLVAYPLPAF